MSSKTVTTITANPGNRRRFCVEIFKGFACFLCLFSFFIIFIFLFSFFFILLHVFQFFFISIYIFSFTFFFFSRPSRRQNRKKSSRCCYCKMMIYLFAWVDKGLVMANFRVTPASMCFISLFCPFVVFFLVSLDQDSRPSEM